MTADNQEYAASVMLVDVNWRLAQALGWDTETTNHTTLELLEEVEEQLWRLHDLEM